MGSSWDSASLKGFQKLCGCTDTSQDNTDISMVRESDYPVVKVESMKNGSRLCFPSSLAQTCTSLYARMGHDCAP